jgi:hypothetical protein
MRCRRQISLRPLYYVVLFTAEIFITSSRSCASPNNRKVGLYRHTVGQWQKRRAATDLCSVETHLLTTCSERASKTCAFQYKATFQIARGKSKLIWIQGMQDGGLVHIVVQLVGQFIIGAGQRTQLPCGLA